MRLGQVVVHRSVPRVVETPILTARYLTCSHHNLILNEAVARRVAGTLAPSSADCDDLWHDSSAPPGCQQARIIGSAIPHPYWLNRLQPKLSVSARLSLSAMPR